MKPAAGRAQASADGMRVMSEARKERGISQGVNENLDELDAAFEGMGVVPLLGWG